jgi:SAM-dependent methyltransferase
MTTSDAHCGASDEFDERYFESLRRASAHWWVRGMQSIATALLDERRHDLRVLDAGCGNGVNLPHLRMAAEGELHAIDISPYALRNARSIAPDVQLAAASTTALPYPSARFDLVVSIDVLQHLTASDAHIALTELRRVVRPGGRLLVRTNSSFGRAAVPQRENWRMYSPVTLRAALRSAGFTVDTLTSANALGSLSAVVLRRAGRHHHDEHHGSGDAPSRQEWRSRGVGIPQPGNKAVSSDVR